MWFTGLSGSGKSTVAVAVERRLVAVGPGRPTCSTATTSATGSTATSGFSAADRDENVRRAAEVARLFADAGVVALVPLISPVPRRSRPRPGRRTPPPGCRSSRSSSTPRSRCASSATRRASTRRPGPGEITGLTGIDDPYEPPLDPELRLTPDDGDADAMAAKVVELLGPNPRPG